MILNCSSKRSYTSYTLHTLDGELWRSLAHSHEAGDMAIKRALHTGRPGRSN